MGANDQRPRYYEGQFLSASDLDAAVDYQRAIQARHTLGAHTWGIAAGLTLRERAAPGAANRVEVILNPGLAWDGFGRAIAVDRPTRLSEDLLADEAFSSDRDAPQAPAQPKGRLVKLWIGYDEVGAKPPAGGFQACTDDEQNARVRETFRFYSGEQANLVSRRAPVTVGTSVIDADAALTEFDATASKLWDTSVPYQTFPTGNRPPRWLVPIGYVRWIARDGELGYFAKLDLDPSDNAADRTRSSRRYIGVVAQNIESADGAVVIHRRDENPLIAHRLAKLLASGYKWDDLKRDLFWVEGNARVVGDAKLAGGALLLRDGNGLDQKTPLYLARHGDAAPADGNRELRAVIGTTDQFDNRFIVGPELPGAAPPNIAPRMVVVSGAGAKGAAEGRVGVNTRDPVAALHVQGDWDGTEDGALRVGGASATVRWTHGVQNVDPSWRVQVSGDDNSALRVGYRTAAPGWEDVLWVTRNATVGVGASAPRNPLAVRAQGDWHELVSFEDPAGGTKWHLNMKALGNNPGNTSGLNFCETGVADFRLFLKAGGDVGVGTMQTKGRLTIEGRSQLYQGQLTVFSDSADVEYDGGSDNLFIFNHKNENAALGRGVTAFLGCKLGVGSTSARNALAVRAIDSSEELISFETQHGVPSWHINQALAGSPQHGLNFVRTGVAGGDGRLFIGEGGNVGIATTDPQQKLHVAGSFLRVDGAGDEQAYLGGVANDVQLGSLKADVRNVSLRNAGDGRLMDLSVSTLRFWGAIPFSDSRHKENITPIADPLGTLVRLRGVSFRWADHTPAQGHADLGVVAQEVAEVLPQIVHESKEGLGVSYQSLIPLLIEAVKELKTEVDGLRAELAALRVAQPAGQQAPRTPASKFK